jgi:DNA mismatch endonuclease (patch repair protein)
MVVNKLPVPSSPSVSGRMSKQRRRDTAPEVKLRRLLHAAGLRFRVAFPIQGMPRRSIDVAFTKAKVAVFVDGCFWHVCPEHATSPASNSEWWATKLAKNRARDLATNSHLEAAGWKVLRVWEHEDSQQAAERVISVLRS